MPLAWTVRDDWKGEQDPADEPVGRRVPGIGPLGIPANLGPLTTGKGCLYIERLADVALSSLEALLNRVISS
jgi:hypothetical protein